MDSELEQETPGRLRSVRVGVAVAIVVGVLGTGGAMAWALSSDDTDDDPPAGQPTTSSATPADEHDHDHDHADSPEAARDRVPGRGHGNRQSDHHEELPPYDDRYAEATDEEREAADTLVADVRETLAAYADPDAAVAAGYRPGPNARGPVVHYANGELARDGQVLDPSAPDGLAYYTPPEGAPVLLGAFFVAPPGTPAPTPAGDLVVWHSHSRSCPQFFVEDGQEDCLDAKRMVHVWTAETVELVARQTGQPVDVRITDPFGAPFMASIERAS